MSLYPVITWLLIISIDSATCLNSTAITGTTVSEYLSTHETSQSSTPIEDLSMDNSLEPSNSYDSSPQITPTMPSEALPSTEESPQSSVLPAATDEISNSINRTIVTTLLEQTTVATGMLESTQNSVLQDVTSENSMPIPTLIPAVVSSTVLEASNQIDEPSSTSVESSSALVEPSQSPAESSSVLTPLISTVSESITDLIEPSSTFVEPVSDIGVTLSYSFNGLNMSLTDFISPSMQPSSDSTYGFLPPLHTENYTISFSSFDYFTSVETISSESVNETTTAFEPASFDSTIMPSESVNETNTPFEPASFDSTIMPSESVNKTNTPFEPASFDSTIMPSESVDETNTAFDPASFDSTIMPSESVDETNTAFEPASFDSTIMPSESVNEADTASVWPDVANSTVEVTRPTLESLEPTTLSEHEAATDSFHSSDSSSGYPSSPFSTVSASETVTLSTGTLVFTDIIASPFSASLEKPTESGVVTLTTSQPTTSVISTTKTTSSSSDITSSTPVTESSTSGQNLPIKSSSGLSTGGKIAIGIIIPLAVIGFIILGVFVYRRYNWTRGSFKNFLQPGVHYRAYTNETFNDDDVSLGGSWRKMTDL